MQKPKLDHIGMTALLVAAMRAIESKFEPKTKRLFEDPFAERLAGHDGLELLKQALSEVGEQPVIAIRTKFIDDQVAKAIASGIRQVVILAAGMDARAFRLPCLSECQVFELDQSRMLQLKKDRLVGAFPVCDRIEIPTDLRTSWEIELAKHGFDQKKQTLWLVEGLLMYLDEKSVLALFEKITDHSSTGSQMLFDILGKSMLTAPHMQKQLAFLEKMGAKWQYGCDDPVELMKSFGWDAHGIQPSEVVPERWPFPIVPLSVPNWPRSFFVEAAFSRA